jgi:hypothetical protein
MNLNKYVVVCAPIFAGYTYCTKGKLFPQLWLYPNIRFLWNFHIRGRCRVRILSTEWIDVLLVLTTYRTVC